MLVYTRHFIWNAASVVTKIATLAASDNTFLNVTCLIREDIT
jgi:hypothetical protein